MRDINFLQQASMLAKIPAVHKHQVIDILLTRTTDRHDREVRIGPTSKIVVAGYYYSGSGALLDFLGDHEGVLTYPDSIGVELRFINLPWGINNLFRAASKRDALYLADILRLYLHMIGRIPIAAATTKKALHLIKVANRTSQKIIASSFSTVHTSNVNRLIRALLDRVDQPAANLRPVLASFFEAYNSGLIELTGKRLVAYDRAVLPYMDGALSFTGDETLMFSVHRDPRTQYDDIMRARLKKKQSPLEASEFCDMYRSRREKALAIQTSREHAKRTFLVSFEDLVCNEAIRRRIRNASGLGETAYRMDRFKPRDSEKNTQLDTLSIPTRARDLIETKLSDYLWPEGKYSGSFSEAS